MGAGESFMQRLVCPAPREIKRAIQGFCKAHLWEKGGGLVSESAVGVLAKQSLSDGRQTGLLEQV